MYGSFVRESYLDLSFLNSLNEAHLLVAGEVGIDQYIWGDTRRISPEAPVPVVEVDSESYKLGLAANVAQNIASLGGRVTLVSVRGKDEDGRKIGGMLASAGIQHSEFLEDDSRPTLRKVRIIAQKQHVVRVDYERSHGLDAALAKAYTEKICDYIPQTDGVILQDYGKGLWKPSTMAFLKHAKAHKKPVFVDPSRLSPLSLYHGVTLLTPNVVEAETLCGFAHEPSKVAGRDNERLQKMASQMLAVTEAEHAIITCGEWGMISLSHGDATLQRIPTFAREVFDVTGAGDTVIAVLSMMMVLGEPLSRCMQVANAAAGIVVGQIGAACVTRQELKEALERLQSSGLIQG